MCGSRVKGEGPVWRGKCQSHQGIADRHSRLKSRALLSIPVAPLLSPADAMHLMLARSAIGTSCEWLTSACAVNFLLPAQGGCRSRVGPHSALPNVQPRIIGGVDTHGITFNDGEGKLMGNMIPILPLIDSSESPWKVLWSIHLPLWWSAH